MSHAPATTAEPPPATGSLNHRGVQTESELYRFVDAAVAAFKAGDWATAANGFKRVRAEMGVHTPRPVLAHAATCLHRLGKYAEAEALASEGLGTQRELIAQKAPVPPESEIFRQWKQPASAAPVITILCTTYNHERYIDATIRGFLSQQTQFSFEILIHDDASTDRTATLIRAWQEKYPSIIRPILQTENQYSRGVRPFDLLLKEARGRYIATCEGDDYWLHPAKLQKQVGFLEQNRQFSCAGHSYYLYNESELSVRTWDHSARDRIVSRRQMMNISRLFWMPTLVFRNQFSPLPVERACAPIGDQFVTSYLGTLGDGVYFETFLGSVRRKNQYSIWTPMSETKKESIRVQTWMALVRMHERLGNAEAVVDLRQRVEKSPLNAAQKSALFLAAQAAAVPEPVKRTP
jgi:glycosyltransferase involved in cell wall biosynthesis